MPLVHNVQGVGISPGGLGSGRERSLQAEGVPRSDELVGDLVD